MRNPSYILPLLAFTLMVLMSCSPKNISSKYYYQHKNTLDDIEESFKRLNRTNQFSIAFTAKNFNQVSIDIFTDSIKYIYDFKVNEKRMADTLTKYHLDANGIIRLIWQMSKIRCIWIKNYDYYVDEKKNSLIFMSVKPVVLNSPFSSKKYYILTYFQQPQYFDNDGLLLDKKSLKRLRKINGEIFRRINDKVCYTISGHFR